MMEPEKPDTNRFILIDLDNCPGQLDHLKSWIESSTRIVICHGRTGIPKVPLDLVPSLAQAIQTEKLEICVMPVNGKNAADFGLTFIAGRLCAQSDPSTEFTIISEDSDLDHAVTMLIHSGRKAQRINGKSLCQDMSLPTVSKDTALIDRIANEYIQCHLSDGKVGPRTRKTFINSISAFIKGKKHPVSTDDILNFFFSRKIAFEDKKGRISYSVASPAHSDIDEDLPF
jgi:hypothetical protein